MAVVRGHQRDTELLLQAKQPNLDALLLLQPLVLYFQKEIFFAKDIAIETRRLGCGLGLAFHQRFGDLTLQAAGKRNQAASVLGQKFLADARLVIKTVQRSFRGDLHQIAVALFIFCEHQQMVVVIAFGRGAMVVFLADVEFATQDGLDTPRFGLVEKMQCDKHVAMIGDRNRGHAQFAYALDELITSQAPSSSE